jgi:hypothetical protein
MLKITVELPIEDGEVIVNAIERAANEGDAAAGLEFAAIGRSDLPIDTVRRLCCDGSVVVVTEDERGAPLDVGRKQRRRASRTSRCCARTTTARCTRAGSRSGGTRSARSISSDRTGA